MHDTDADWVTGDLKPDTRDNFVIILAGRNDMPGTDADWDSGDLTPDTRDNVVIILAGTNDMPDTDADWDSGDLTPESDDVIVDWAICDVRMLIKKKGIHSTQV